MTKPAAETKEVRVHPTALVHPSVEFDTGVAVGPYSVIGEGVRIGRDTWVGPHVVIEERTSIGKNCKVFQFTSIGAPPQDIGYKGEETETVIGDNNIIREFVTIHRGTARGKGKTVCGDDNLFMNYVHIAHDCEVGNDVIVANAATFAGHVTVEDHAIVGGLVPIHQYVRIGAYSMVGGASAVSKDVPPYVMAVGNRAHIFGLNAVGLRRQGFSRADIKEIKKWYNILFRSHLKMKEAVEKLKSEAGDSVHAKRFIEFIEKSTRGVMRERIKVRPEGEEG
ncbi:MAG: acyl-ACP--UDP-N-acetylglucosamine O-acyltransferase [Thermodesulfobacteriota bacterium]